MTRLERQYAKGQWVPAYSGNRFTCARRDGKFGEIRQGKFRSLTECRDECIRLNRRRKVAA